MNCSNMLLRSTQIQLWFYTFFLAMVMIYFIENLCNVAGRSQSHLTIQLRHLAYKLHMSAQYLWNFFRCSKVPFSKMIRFQVNTTTQLFENVFPFQRFKAKWLLKRNLSHGLVKAIKLSHQCMGIFCIATLYKCKCRLSYKLAAIKTNRNRSSDFSYSKEVLPSELQWRKKKTQPKKYNL